MAEKLHDDSERLRRIELVGDLFLRTGYSNRNLSRLLSQDSNNGFKISNATVCDYIQRYRIIHSDKAEQIDSLIEANKGSSIKDHNVIKRVYKVVDLICNNYSIDEISKILNQSYWVTYYDIDIRLKKINPELYEKIKNSCSK